MYSHAAPPASASSDAAIVTAAGADAPIATIAASGTQSAAGDRDAPEERRVGAAADRLAPRARGAASGSATARSRRAGSGRAGAASPPGSSRGADAPVRRRRHRRATRAAATPRPAAPDCATRSIAACGPCQRSRPSPCAKRNPVYAVARKREHDGRPRERGQHAAPPEPAGHQPQAADRAVAGQEPRAPDHPRAPVPSRQDVIEALRPLEVDTPGRRTSGR